MITVAVSLVAILAFAVIAIDVAIIFLAKIQLQNAADAAALAGALAYVLSDGDQDVAVAEAIRVAGANFAVQDQQQPVVITAADVSFPEGNRIRVVTHRTPATLDPVALYFLRVVNPSSDNHGSVMARASAAVFPVSGTDCLKPWCFPDQWEDVNNDSIFDDTIDYYDPQITGYKVPDDIGRQVTLKLSSSNKSPRMGWYYAVDYAPINTGDPVHTGADAYREWIAECEPYMVSVGDQVQIEPGNMVGPTAQGMAALIDQDPAAEWDPVTGDVINSAYAVSPRVVKAICFDPTMGVQTDVNGRDYLTIVKILVLFLEEHVSGGEVVGRFIQRSTDGEICPGCDEGFLFQAALVE
jgi:hypothetical protein